MRAACDKVLYGLRGSNRNFLVWVRRGYGARVCTISSCATVHSLCSFFLWWALGTGEEQSACPCAPVNARSLLSVSAMVAVQGLGRIVGRLLRALCRHRACSCVQVTNSQGGNLCLD